MTPQEALTEALLAYTPPIPGPRFPLIHGEADEVAYSILAALPEGWVLVNEQNAVDQHLRLGHKGRLRNCTDSYCEGMGDALDTAR